MDIVVNGIPLVIVILALVEFAKQIGVTGKASLVFSMVLGTGLGVAYQVSIAPPADFNGWFGAIVFGLALGLTASGLYDVAKNLRK